MATTWQPKWQNEMHLSAWDRLKEALRRDWEQTKFDLKIGDGEQLNQDAADTLQQAAGTEPIPPPHQRNPLKINEDWQAAEHPISYGYMARRELGDEHPTWNDGIEAKLRSDWESGQAKADPTWDKAKDFVRYGYEYKLGDSLPPTSVPPTSANEGPVRERELDVLRQLSGDGPGFRDRLDEYMVMSQQLVDAMKEALDKQDAAALEGDARSLKGVSAQVGAHRVAGDSELIENAAAKRDLAGARVRLDMLKTDHRAALDKLQSIRASAFP